MKRLILLFAALGAASVTLALMFTSDGLLRDDQQAEAQTTERPNFVFVMTDDLDERSMQDLPGIREIMSTNGTTFENAYVTYSLCCPSRASILTGQYPHNHDIIGNGLPEGGEEKFRLGPDDSTIATWLDDAGYQTKLSATVGYSTATDTATLDPTNSLRSGVTYKAVVTTGAKDTVGNPLEQQHRWFFTVS